MQISREIKFRGICISDGEFKGKFVYGDLLQKNGKTFITPHVNAVNLNGHIGKLIIMHEVYPKTVGQYTGLKDRNGKGICEGDIVQFDDMGEEGYEYREGYDFVNRAVVTFENGRYTLDKFMDTNSGVLEELRCHDELYETLIHSEVIGNIYDNPELLEVSHER